MRNICIILLLLFTVSFSKTSFIENIQNSYKSLHPLKNDSINSFISKEWKCDSLGCLEKRIIYVDSVIYYINNYIHSYSELIKYFGKPNYLTPIEVDSTSKEYTVDSTINALYNTFSLCDKAKNDSIVYVESWVLISFYGYKDTSFFAFHILD